MTTPITTPRAELSPMLPEAFTVVRIWKETYDTFTMELKPMAGGYFHFEPGQFNMVYVYGVGEIPVSISGDPGRPGSLLHTVRAVGTVSNAMAKLKRGSVVGIRGPFGTHWPIETLNGKDVLIVAGGVGLPPLRSVIYYVLENRDKFGKFCLCYGARTPQDLVFTRELEQWRGRFDMQVEVTVDAAATGWRGDVGVVTTLISRAKFDPTHGVAMVCGPEIMMRFTIMELQKRGLSDDQILISMERNMKCGVGLCGHCQLGTHFICKDGPVYRFDNIRDLFGKREV